MLALVAVVVMCGGFFLGLLMLDLVMFAFWLVVALSDGLCVRFRLRSSLFLVVYLRDNLLLLMLFPRGRGRRGRKGGRGRGKRESESGEIVRGMIADFILFLFFSDSIIFNHDF